MYRCKNCGWRDTDKICNNPHITEPMGLYWRDENFPIEDTPPKEDCLIYSYDESGYFRAGDNFGCIYFKDKPKQDADNN